MVQRIVLAVQGVLIRLWTYLDGKKRGIACAWWGLAIPVYTILQSNGVPLPKWVVVVVAIVGLVFTYVGLGHGIVKSATAGA